MASPQVRRIVRGAGRIEQILVTGERVVVHETGNGVRRVRLFDKTNGNAIRELAVGSTWRTSAVVIAPDARSIFSTFEEGRVMQIDLDTGETVPEQAITWTTTGRILFRDKNHTFGFFDAQSLKRLGTRKLPDLSAAVTNARGSFVACVTETRVHVWNVGTDVIVALPLGTASPAVGDEDVYVVEERGSHVVCFDIDGHETRRVDLRARATRARGTTTRARVVRDGARAAVLCETPPSPATPFPSPPELVLVDVEAGHVLGSHKFEREIGAILLRRDNLIFATAGGRLEHLALDRLRQASRDA
jgi:hypothetical protein